MKRITKMFLVMCGRKLCTAAGIAAIFSVYSCRGIFYQPKEPEGFKDFIERNR